MYLMQAILKFEENSGTLSCLVTRQNNCYAVNFILLFSLLVFVDAASVEHQLLVNNSKMIVKTNSTVLLTINQILGIFSRSYLFMLQDHVNVFQEFSPGSSGRMTTMGVYVRDLLLGQVCFQLMCAFCIFLNVVSALAIFWFRWPSFVVSSLESYNYLEMNEMSI